MVFNMIYLYCEKWRKTFFAKFLIMKMDRHDRWRWLQIG
ncbi:hypothetical protein [Bacillus phage PfEFR-5]|uniref:Uncharacterized protein n=1 Tax=Bacillus phage PfEFR-5 TaxID=1868599 RepID=A0A1B1P8L0_9CAUD|nr:hypothetical protein BI093_gp63 [Bacillus phage PfEFR-5]ANT40432.1 hypothetical protein [Bacillus phage PfEFR-5]